MNYMEDGGMRLKRTSLYEIHREAGARSVEFAGWEMPVLFTGIIEEHLAVRSSAGLFDISHMGEIEVAGPEADDFLQHTLTNDLSRIGNGEALYTVMCYENGGIVDDLLVYRLSGRKYLLCVNAANAKKDYEWLLENRKGDVEITDNTDDYALLALQGPIAVNILEPLVSRDIKSMKKFSHFTDEVDGVEAIVARTGYTGEDGFEIFIPAESGPRLWERLISLGSEHGIKPAGLGARDTLRLEMGYLLYDHEISADTNPLEAGLGWLVKFDKGDFLGREALLSVKEKGLERRLVGIEMIDRGIPRHGYKMFGEGLDVGYITSGNMSPSLRIPIGMGYVSSSLSGIGTELEVEIRSQRRKARVVKLPFYKPAAH